ncbi:MULTISPECIES: DNA internalization-related competence protein ComEC/Rec2 [Streptococcus]|uniref:DNA internalization-related competence protein ComEC/Rec2 n=1 Tax=Streptococcus TaxID=1301 RepID=UPI00025B5EB0|nr:MULTISPECIES: DNA internalization-related competence protein ComEC/Rec2 [Streptococcus]EID71074.1 DNA internalization competence protein ComEC/Rec2-like protein [Streptococcus pseudopneumoniae SK674]MBF9636996.1 DNA internalization-related competence protein ComEC/Rec2 [Streptococcus pseudopneumoniae]MBF9638471.1 DNA internalization-related competence protein ComEC/Rec2 [Streptococcus pseudopneumoniae]MBF9640576.1 DNA internalization-related competence protein ComEC/Rec2 [Streptococcus pseud
MLQWIKNIPIPLIYLSFLLLWFYYAIFSASYLALLGFVFLLVCLFFQFPWKSTGKVLVICGVFGFWFLFQNWQQSQASQNLADSVERVRILPDTVKVNGDSLSFRGKADGRIFQVYYKLQSEEEKEAFQALTDLHEIGLEGKLSEPEGQRNFGGFNYQAYLKTQGIYQTLNIKTIQSLQKIGSWDIGENLSSLRRKAVVWIKTHFPDPMRNYMTGLLLGHLDTDFEEMNELYSSLGIIHLFALSGMQVGFFMDGFKKLLFRLGLTQEKLKWLIYPFSLIYAGLTGFSASVIRSLLQKLLAQHGVKGLDNFALTVLILFIVMPNLFLTAGGVLSCAYAFILTMTGKEEDRLKAVARESLVISLGILPILSFYFAEFQPWSILLTFVFSFLFDLVFLPLLSILFALSFLYPVIQLNFIFEWLEGMIRLVSQVASRPLVFGQPNAWLLILLLISLALVYDLRKNIKRLTVLSLLVTGLFFLTKHPLENEITMMDVGQGESLFLRDVTGKTILIDVGGKAESDNKIEKWQEKTTTSNSQRNLIPYLKSRGVAKIDQLILTNTDKEHVGDLLEVTKAFHVGEILVSKGSLKQKEIVAELQATQTKVRSVTTGENLAIFGSQLEILSPRKMGGGGYDDSLVLYGKLLDKYFLFTGNLEEKGEKDLLKQYPDLEVDVLKASQHGSKKSSSSAFLEQLKPEITLISVGKNNRTKLPHQETLTRLEGINSKVYRTDQQGAIRFKGWKSWEIESVR